MAGAAEFVIKPWSVRNRLFGKWQISSVAEASNVSISCNVSDATAIPTVFVLSDARAKREEQLFYLKNRQLRVPYQTVFLSEDIASFLVALQRALTFVDERAQLRHPGYST